jgi:uronate dehydrogenase
VRVLVTGSSGKIGSVLCPALAAEHEVRGLDVREPAAPFPGRFVLGDCADPEVALDAVRDVDAVIQLAGPAGEADLPAIVKGHILATAALLEAMATHGARRMVFASSNHAVGRTPRTTLVTAETRPRPDTFYGVGKVAGEALLSLYADRRGLDCVALRIGSFRPRPRTRRELCTWLSHEDGVRLFQAALTADMRGFAVVYGISANRDAWWDLTPGRELGYVPVDDASAFEADIERRPDDDAEAAYVGGPFADPGIAVAPFPSDESEGAP